MMKLTQDFPPRAGGEKRSGTIHLYCVVGNGTELDCRPFELNGHQVFAVPHGDLAALVSSAPPLAYKSMKREEIIPHLVAHQAVIEQVMKEHTVVPVKFGTTARGEAEVQRILEKGYSQLKATLEAMEAKIELDVVAQWREMNAIFSEIGEDAEIKRLKDSIFSRPSGEVTREERIQIGRLVKSRLDRMRDERAAEIMEALKPMAQDLCLHALPDDRMILNMAFLLDRAREGEVGETLERLNGRYADSVDFRCVGPLPPYSFATVEVKTFEFETIDRARRLLGLQEDAVVAEIREAYRRLIQQCHPDHAMAAPNTTAPFEEVTEAYRLLGEYRQVGSSFREPDVSEAVAVRLFQWFRESTGA